MALIPCYFFGGVFEVIFNLGLNLFLFLLCYKVAIIIHESGHLIASLLVGASPRRFIIGKGYTVFEKKIKGVRVILKNKIVSGLVISAFSYLDHIKLKLVLYNSGGFIANFLVVAILFKIYGISINILYEVPISFLMLFANLILGISVLFPYSANIEGQKTFSDGLSIFKILFFKKNQLTGLIYLNELYDAADCIAEKKYLNAIEIYKNIQSKIYDPKVVNYNLSVVYIKLGEYEKSKELLTELLTHIQEDAFKNIQSYVYNDLAWVYLIQNDLDMADKYSKLAYDIDSKTIAIKDTRASVLIELGNFEKAIKELQKSIDFNFPNGITLAASIYVSLAYYGQGELNKADKYISFVTDNIELLDSDVLALYKRAIEKMNSSK